MHARVTDCSFAVEGVVSFSAPMPSKPCVVMTSLYVITSSVLVTKQGLMLVRTRDMGLA